MAQTDRDAHAVEEFVFQTIADKKMRASGEPGQSEYWANQARRNLSELPTLAQKSSEAHGLNLKR
ncbi:hypothetical protein ELG72_37385 [Rhizobium leguminosarum]|uniref:hypothetical protein n=1 Tax=Rhizobium johnstonii TaxID=3019933 RepID=UPI0010EF850D|nr:hypothetical protein ELG72_37385 [Rhizobium leguminosarum]